MNIRKMFKKIHAVAVYNGWFRLKNIEDDKTPLTPEETEEGLRVVYAFEVMRFYQRGIPFSSSRTEVPQEDKNWAYSLALILVAKKNKGIISPRPPHPSTEIEKLIQDGFPL